VPLAVHFAGRASLQDHDALVAAVGVERDCAPGREDRLAL
jgi:hypothetical protein